MWAAQEETLKSYILLLSYNSSMLLYPCVCIHILCVTELLYMSTALKAYISDVFLVAIVFLHSNLPCLTPVFPSNQRQKRLFLERHPWGKIVDAQLR